MVPLFKAVVRPILEYLNSVWCPFLRKHIDLIEDVQRRFTKIIKGMLTLSYEERLELLSIPSLEYRRLRGDLIEVYKVMNKIYDPITTNSLFTESVVTHTRGHKFKLEKTRTNKKKYQMFFTNRVINAWNNLPAEAVEASSTNAFKNKIDHFYRAIMFTTKIDIMEL